MKDIDFAEQCEDCGLPSTERLIRFQGGVNADNGDAYFNHGLGKVVRSRNDVRAELSRVKGETGRELVEIGNEVLKKTKPKKTEWNNEQIMHDYKKARSAYRQ
jgi:hypothetical protein